MKSRQRVSHLRPCVLGIDFGTLSARALLVDPANGREIASASVPYASGVIEGRLPGSKAPLKPGTALQDPADYLSSMAASVKKVLRASGIAASQVIGAGAAFTSCTVLPVEEDGTPLSFRKQWARNPHAWVKLWKHHATQPEADAINELGRRRGEAFIGAYGGRYSSEWFFSKILETVRESPEVYEAAARFVEAGDWITWRLTGQPSRNLAAAGFKGMRVQATPDGGWGYPSPKFFRELHPALEHVIERKLAGPVLPLGARAGELTREMARALGLTPGIPVAAGNIDAHSAVPACGVAEPGALVMIMGTSTCHMLLGHARREVEGICGVVQDGIVSGFWGYEAGQPGVGDLFAWYAAQSPPARLRASPHEALSREAAALRPGESGLLALDWWNGNRSILVDADLSGVLLGLTLSTQPHQIYRALIEATAFGTRKIVEAFTEGGLPIHRVHACGGLARENPLILRIYADVLQRPIHVPPIHEATAFGAAMHGSVAAGIHAGIPDAVRAMTRRPGRIYTPSPEHSSIYDALYREYSRLHDYFGRDAKGPLKQLRRIRDETTRA